MRIGVIFEPCPNAYYRAVAPMTAMERRGHHIVWPDATGKADIARLRGCAVVHVYRRSADDTQRVLAELARRGTAIVYDNDDDYTAFPTESPEYKRYGGAIGQRIFAMTVKVARMASVFTTTTDVLAEKYRTAGVASTCVIANHLPLGFGRAREGHDGLVIGWIAGIDHQADIARIPIVPALQRILSEDDKVRVVSFGLDLGLGDRYRHGGLVPYEDLPRNIAGFDIGIAPLADIPFNRARSDVKLKEYAACGVPWLASPAGPYRSLGELQGGMLVSDDAWYEALRSLTGSRWKRWRLGRCASRWARHETIDAAADQWEDVFQKAADHSSGATRHPGARCASA